MIECVEQQCGDIFCIPTAIESFGTVTIEAMAAGLPVVATDTPGCRDLVENGRTGFKVTYGDWSKMAGIIDSLLEDEATRKRISRNAAQEAKAKYSWNSVVEKLETAYLDLTRDPLK